MTKGVVVSGIEGTVVEAVPAAPPAGSPDQAELVTAA